MLLSINVAHWFWNCQCVQCICYFMIKRFWESVPHGFYNRQKSGNSEIWNRKPNLCQLHWNYLKPIWCGYLNPMKQMLKIMFAYELAPVSLTMEKWGLLRTSLILKQIQSSTRAMGQPDAGVINGCACNAGGNLLFKYCFRFLQGLMLSRIHYFSHMCL